MAERSGDAKLDELIAKFMAEPLPAHEDDDPADWVSMDHFRDPANASGKCGELVVYLKEFLHEHGLPCDFYRGEPRNPDAVVTSWEADTPDEFGYTDRTLPGYRFEGRDGSMDEGHVAVQVKLPSGTYLVDFTASQYGYTEMPMVQRMKLSPAGKAEWERTWPMAPKLTALGQARDADTPAAANAGPQVGH